VGRTDIEDALQRLENAILEETRMAAAEALKGIGVLQDIVETRMRGVEGMLQGVGDIVLQGLDEIKKDICQKGINGARIITVLLVLFTIDNVFLSDAENAANQTANAVDTAPVIGLATVPGTTERINTVDDDKVQGIQDTIEAVGDRTRNIGDLGARAIDGAHVIPTDI
jgi:hypothetical protein